MEIPTAHHGCSRLEILLGKTPEEVFKGHIRLRTGRPVDMFYRESEGLNPEESPAYVRQYYGVYAPPEVIKEAWEATPDAATIEQQREANTVEAVSLIVHCPGSQFDTSRVGHDRREFLTCGLDCARQAIEAAQNTPEQTA